MTDADFVSPQAAGLDPVRRKFACELLERFSADGTLPAGALIAGVGDSVVAPFLCGRQTLDGSASVRDDAMFLVASITKPIVGTAALMLVERGEITLSDKVIEYVPEFGRNGKSGVRIRHLLTHTSGLPDMLPQNVELRKEHAPLSAFVEGTCDVGLDFATGRGVKYQSMGFAMLGEIVHRVTGLTCAEFVRKEIFEPLGMLDSHLGLPDEWFESADGAAKLERVVEIQVPDEQVGQDWNWNGRYWRTLGAPWGGLLTTPVDLARFCRMMLGHGDMQILSQAAIRAATRNQLEVMPDVPEIDRRTRGWGLGWRLNWPAHSANFGDLSGSRSYGHWGATGTVCWMDPENDSFVVLLTTRPQEPHGTWLARVSNAVSAALP